MALVYLVLAPLHEAPPQGRQHNRLPVFLYLSAKFTAHAGTVKLFMPFSRATS
jgi:hypothetical protein